MPAWDYKGADRATGEDRSGKIDAETERDAVLQLKKMGVLMESLIASNSPSVSLAPLSSPAKDLPAGGRYAEMREATRWLDSASLVLKVFSILAFISAVLSVVVTISGAETNERRFAGITGAAIEMFVGAAMMGAAALLNMCSHAGTILRDIGIAVVSQKTPDMRAASDPLRNKVTDEELGGIIE